LAYGISFLILTLIHTILVLSMFWTSFALVNHFTLKEAFIPYLEALVLWGIPISAPAEAILAGLVGASVTTRLKESLVRNKSLQTEEKE